MYTILIRSLQEVGALQHALKIKLKGDILMVSVKTHS